MPRKAISQLSLLMTVFIAFALVGCGSKESKFEGVYQSSKEHARMELKPDHKGTITVDGRTNDVSWEMIADDKISVNFMMKIEMLKTSEGLIDPEGTVWKKQ
jgi:hypothetical protein